MGEAHSTILGTRIRSLLWAGALASAASTERLEVGMSWRDWSSDVCSSDLIACGDLTQSFHVGEDLAQLSGELGRLIRGQIGRASCRERVLDGV